MTLIEAFVRNPVKVAVGVLLVALFGSIALVRMPKQLTPEVQIPTLTIETRWPGASPQEVEREIVQAQEEQLQGVEGMKKMSSESHDSRGVVTLEFEIGTDMSQALLLVNSRLQQVREYPEEVREPVISTSNLADRPIAWFILRAKVVEPEVVAAFQREHAELAEALEPVRRAHNSGLRLQRLKSLVAERPELAERLGPLMPRNLDVPGMRLFAEDFIEAEFERVEGISSANVLGGREEELQVVVDAERLAARRLTINDVREALRQQNVDTSGGDLWEGKRRWVVRTLGQYRSPEQVAATILARRDGQPVYVRDVAEVRLGFKKPDGLVRNFGDPAIAINCLRATGANVLDVMRGLRATCERLNGELLADRGLQLEQVYDETEYINSAIGLVNSNIVIGGLLTVGVLLLFLRSGRSTLVIALAIPTSIVGTFLAMYLMKRSLNVISLAGLAFAVGMLVDNAVVVLENIYRHYQQGAERVRAAVVGAKEVWGAVVASTLTTLAVFLPVLFVEQEAGQLFRDIALAISAAVGLSLLVSVTLIPTAAARILSEEQGQSGGQHTAPTGWLWNVLLAPLDRLAGGLVSAVVRINRVLLGSVVLRLVTAAAFVGASIGLSYALMPKVEYLPDGNRNLVIGILIPPPGYNLDRLAELGEQLERDLRPYWDIDPDSPEIQGLGAPAIADYFYVARGRQVFFGLRAVDPLRAGELVPLVRETFLHIPGAIGLAFQSSLFEGGLNAGRTIDVEITGPELTKLVALGGQVMGQAIGAIEEAQVRPVPSLDLSSPELHVRPKWDHAADLAISAADLGYAVDALIDGAKATDYYLGGDKIDLSIVGAQADLRRTQDVAALPIATPDGYVVPLAAVADVALDSGPEQINRRERQRAITITVTPPARVPLQSAMDTILTRIVEPMEAGGQLEGGYRIHLAGTADKLRQAWDALKWNLVLALLITYLLMAALFESWLYPLVIIFSVPLGAVGGFLGLAALNTYQLQPLDVVTMLGFVILIGTVVNNPILIVHQSLLHMREQEMSPSAAIVESVRTRIRPIFMTTLTTVLGLLPLVLIQGAGNELYRGLGSVVLGGLLVSTVFTLVLVPVLFSLMMEARAALAGLLWPQRKRGEKPGGQPTSGAERAPSGAGGVVLADGQGDEDGRREVVVHAQRETARGGVHAQGQHHERQAAERTVRSAQSAQLDESVGADTAS